MFYEPSKRNHGLPHDPFKAIVAPRPIGWITSMSARGEINLAPYSFFNGVSSEPPMVMFASEGLKDSVVFIEETKEFVCNFTTWDLREQMNTTSGAYPRGVDEMKEAGLEAASSVLVKPPRVKASPCAMECKWLQTVRLNDVDGKPSQRFIKDGLLDTAAMQPIARAGYHDYFVSTPETKFSLRRPKGGGADNLDALKIAAE